VGGGGAIVSGRATTRAHCNLKIIPVHQSDYFVDPIYDVSPMNQLIPPSFRV